jgi:hypothetical protein
MNIRAASALAAATAACMLSGCVKSDAQTARALPDPAARAAPERPAVSVQPTEALAEAPAHEVAVASTRHAAPPSPFHVVARWDAELGFGGKGETPMVVAGTAFARVTAEGALRIDRHLDAAIGRTAYAHATLVGDFPSDAWLVVEDTVGREGTEIALAHWEKSHWRVMPMPEETLRVTPWKGHGLLGHVGRVEGKLHVFAGGAAPPRFDRSLEVAAFDALPDGTAVAVGTKAGHDDQWFAQSVDPAGKPSALAPIPAMNDPRVQVRGPNEAYAFTETTDGVLLLAWDGASWKPREVPRAPGIVALAVSDQGTLWLVPTPENGRGVVWKQPQGGAWESMALPADLTENGETVPFVAASLWVRNDADPWIAGTLDGGPSSAVVRLRSAAGAQAAGEKPVQFMSAFDMWRERLDREPVAAASDACMSRYGGAGDVVLLDRLDAGAAAPDVTGLAKTLAENADFRELPILVLRHGDKERRLGIGVQGFEQGKQLLATLKKLRPAAKPEFVCHVYPIEQTVATIGE